MKLIKEFNIFSHTVKITYLDDMEKYGCVGLYRGSECKIFVEKSSKKCPKKTSQVELCLCHEIMHCWFESIGRDDLSEDEALVEAMGQCLLQYENTKR